MVAAVRQEENDRLRATLYEAVPYELRTEMIRRYAFTRPSAPGLPLPRYPAPRGESRRVIRSNSSVSGSPTSRPNSVSP